VQRSMLYTAWFCTNPQLLISLCNLCVLYVSVVSWWRELLNHRDTENTEIAQRRASWWSCKSFRVLFSKPAIPFVGSRYNMPRQGSN